MMPIWKKLSKSLKTSRTNDDDVSSTPTTSSQSTLTPIESLKLSGAVGAGEASPNDISRFRSDPVGFMRDNIVIVGTMPRLNSNLTEPAQLALYEWKKKQSETRKVYRLVPRQDEDLDGSRSITAYFCDYHQDGAPSLRAGNKSRILLTPTLSGCSIGFKAEADGSLFVCHANARTAPNQAVQQRAAIEELIGPNATMIEPSQYQNGCGNMATVIGLRDAEGWSIQVSSFSAGPIFRHEGPLRSTRVETREYAQQTSKGQTDRDRNRSHPIGL